GPAAPLVGAVVPCFEEADHLAATLDALGRVLEGATAGDWELVVVTSAAARDGTPALARTLAEGDERLRVVEQPADDPGYGRAVALGIAACRSRWILLLDGDGQFDPSDLPTFLEAARTYDAVAGIRVTRRHSLTRLVAGLILCRVGARVVALPVTDTASVLA